MNSFAGDTDADLLAYMSMQEEDPEAARDAWAELYARHAAYLHAVCQRAYGDLLGGDKGVGDLVAETFHRAFHRARLFTSSNSAREVPGEDLSRIILISFPGLAVPRGSRRPDAS